MTSSQNFNTNTDNGNANAFVRVRRNPVRTFSSLSPRPQSSEKIDIKIVEVGARDGLQNESQIVSTNHKIEFIMKLAQAGCQIIESASFVSPKWVPTMADSSQVMKELYSWKKKEQQHHEDNVPILPCLVPNLQGFQAALEATDYAVDEVAIFGSASEAFSTKNINCTIEESIDRFRDVADCAKDHNIPVRGYVSCVVGCPYQGHVTPSEVARVTELMFELGCYEVSLGDTIGVGTVGTTAAMLDEVLRIVTHSSTTKTHNIHGSSSPNLAVHFHDTYGQALTNIHVAIQKGITTVDSSVGGLGGCPYADGASGNVATEDVVYMLNGMSLNTGINLEQLVEAGTFIHNVLGRTTRSKVAMAMEAKRRNSTT